MRPAFHEKALWFLAFLATPLGAQIASFEVQEETILIEEKSGLRHYLLAEGMDIRSIRVSPDGSRLIYYLHYDGYASDPRIPVRLWSPSNRYAVTQYEVPTCSRYLDTVEWIDSQLVLLAGDRCGVVVDTAGGKLLYKIPGNLFAISPDRSTIAFREFLPNGTPIYVPDEVHLLFLAPEKPLPGKNVAVMHDGSFRIYPSDPRQILLKAYENDELAPGIESGLLWFSDNRRLAFIERNAGKLWLVVLQLDTDHGALAAEHARLQLSLPPDNPLAYSSKWVWVAPDERAVYQRGPDKIVLNLAKLSVETDPQK